jgi:hypothetical protein
MDEQANKPHRKGKEKPKHTGGSFSIETPTGRAYPASSTPSLLLRLDREN